MIFPRRTVNCPFVPGLSEMFHQHHLRIMD